jgi:hypothetical protein
MRYLLGKAEEDEEAIELLEDFIGEDKIFDLLSIFGLNTGLNETSSAGGGGAPGAPGGFIGIDVEEENENERIASKSNMTKAENIDLSIVDNVIRLIMEKGIMK